MSTQYIINRISCKIFVSDNYMYLLTLDILHTFNILRKCMSLQYSTYFKIQ